MASIFSLSVAAPAATQWTIETVRGPVPASQLGLALEHEHILVDFIGADRVNTDRYDPNEVFRVALPHLEAAAAWGVKALFECTPAYLARDPLLLKRLSEASGLHLVTNTGLYGAANDTFLPDYAFTETAAELAARWTEEARDGIDGTGIKPGFIKTAVDREPDLSPVDRKLIEAAALTHRETGLTIAVHTGAGPGLEILAVLEEYGVRPDAFIWVHAQSATDEAILEAARTGAWISLDGINRNSLERHAAALALLKDKGLLDRALLSHDAGWFDPEKPGGGTYRGYQTLFTDFIPLLHERGFTADEIARTLTGNVAEAFARRTRLINPDTRTK
ncbi:MAG: hypothetical protein R3F07_08915 [Opitutaceae bacterium]